MKVEELLEHKDWLSESPTEKLCEKIVAHLKKEADRYEKREDYKGDDPVEHVKKELFDKIEEMLK